MGFSEDVRMLAEKSLSLRDKLQTEEAVKHSIIMPFLQLLGYNVFDPNEIVPEFTSDHGIKKGEKVDYAIFKDGEPHILIEVKGVSCKFTNESSQLYRYFSVTSAKFAILTNGFCYQFFSDLDDSNKMDKRPFLVLDFDNLREQALAELKKFHKSEYDVDTILSTANDLKYINLLKDYLNNQFKEPDKEFTRFILRHVYEGKIMPSILDRFEPIVKKSMSAFINELVNDRLKFALDLDSKETLTEQPAQNEIEEFVNNHNERVVETTEEELEAYVLVKILLRDVLDGDHQITYKDTLSYVNVLLDNKVSKWICRFYFTSARKSIEFKDGKKVQIGNIEEIEQYKEKLIEVVQSITR